MQAPHYVLYTQSHLLHPSIPSATPHTICSNCRYHFRLSRCQSHGVNRRLSQATPITQYASDRETLASRPHLLPSKGKSGKWKPDAGMG